MTRQFALAFGAACALLLGATLTASAQSGAAAPATPAPSASAALAAAAAIPLEHADYAKPEHWVCRPGRADACTVNIDATVVKANGSTSLERFKPNPKAKIDCFYIYPTVSTDPFATSDLVEDAAERSVVRTQLARFASQCRLFAPMYRQITLSSLRSNRSGGTIAPPAVRHNIAQGTTDIVDAWNYYLRHDNQGRGIVLIGHSQGAGQVTRLITQQIEGKPVQKQIVSALILGSSVQVPKDKDVGGTFKTMPLCRSAAQIGCVITYASFRADVPPGTGGNFGAGRGDTVAACTNPAALAGGKGAPKAYFSNRPGVAYPVPGSLQQPWSTKAKAPIETPFVRAPGLVSTECVEKAGKTYLEVTINADPNDPRADNIGGDVMANGKPDPFWGLHNIDANLGMGELVDIVGKQAKTYLKQATKAP